MSQDIYSELAWLPAAPADFQARCRALAEAGNATAGVAVRGLAQHGLNEHQLRALAATIASLEASGASLHPLVPFTLGIVGNATLEPLVPALVSSAARHGIALRCVVSDFAQAAQSALASDSSINQSAADGVLLAIDYRGLPLSSRLGDPAASASAVAESLDFIEMLSEGFGSNAKAISIVQTVAPPPETVFGSLDAATAGTARHACASFNRELFARFADTAHAVLDVAALAETVGLANWHAAKHWHLAKLAFDARFLPIFAEHVSRIIAALCGKSRRCLVLDLDDTLWGGVVGDVGADALLLGNGDATGEAFLDLQRLILTLRERGVVLAVASKNDDAVARAVFREHPEMLLREEHIAVFQANWEDKATNIAAIAERLSLGLDALVFLDDNEFERQLVRRFLPEVAVPELPKNPALYARTLAAAGYFESLVFSNEDRRRADSYRENAERVSLAKKSHNIEDYLKSLDMEIIFQPFDAVGRSRIAQLISKTNQFNLTTRRYSELDVAALEADPGCFTLQARLIDTFGDNGMIGVVICRSRDDGVWQIDTWLMSCRVLGRGVERAVLAEILRSARAAGVRRIVGTYIPSDRNGMVKDHYKRLGFRREFSNDNEEWHRDTTAEIEEAPMRVVRRGLAEP